MNRTLRTAFMLLLTLFCGAAWSAEVTFDPTADTSPGQSITKDGITITVSDGDLSGGDNYELSTGTYLTFTGADITKISFTFSGLGFFDPCPISQTSSDDYFDGWSKNYYWTPGDESKEHNTVTFMATSDAKISSVTVEYKESATPSQDESYTIAQLADAAKSFESVSLELNNAKVVYGESDNGNNAFVLRENGYAIDIYSSTLSFPVGATVSGSVTVGITYNRGIISTSDISGKTSADGLTVNNPGTYEQDPLDIQPSELASHPGDLVHLSDVTITVNSQGTFGTAGGIQFIISNPESYNFQNNQTADISGWFNQPGQSGYAASLKISEAEIHYAAPAAPVITGETPFKESTVVTITAEEGTTIHYTLNGSNPTTLSPLYTGPITLTETTTVKALAERNELASEMAEKTFEKEVPVEWKDVTIDGLVEGGVDVPNAILHLDSAVAVFSGDYGKSWVLHDGKNAIHWTTSQWLAMNNLYKGTVRVKVEYNGGFLQAYDIDGETNTDSLEVQYADGDYDYHFTPATVNEIANGEHKGDFIIVKNVTVNRDIDEQTGANYYIDEDGERINLANSKAFSYYWSGYTTDKYNVGGWYDKEGEIFVASLRVSVAPPTIDGEEEFGTSTKITITPENPGDAIYYTIDGSTPDLYSDATKTYSGPFYIYDTTTVKAIAVRYEGTSDVATKTFTLNPALGIDKIEAESSSTDKPVYNIAGQRVNSNYKGIVIQNGRKVVRK